MKSAIQNAHGSSPTMPKAQTLPVSFHWLIPLIVVLALITAGTGLFSQGGQGVYTFQTLHGQQVEMYGRGVYARDSLLAGAGFRGTDAVTLFISLPLLVWTSELLPPLLAGTAPGIIGPYTTLFTHGLDLAVIVPTTVLTGILLLQRKPLGYLLAAPLLILISLVGVVVIAQTVSQTLAGLIFPIGVYIGMVGSWIVLGAFAVGLTVAFFRNLLVPACPSQVNPT